MGDELGPISFLESGFSKEVSTSESEDALECRTNEDLQQRPRAREEIRKRLFIPTLSIV